MLWHPSAMIQLVSSRQRIVSHMARTRMLHSYKRTIAGAGEVECCRAQLAAQQRAAAPARAAELLIPIFRQLIGSARDSRSRCLVPPLQLLT